MSFFNPLLLWGLLAISIPIIIHLLNRRRFRIVRWAAMDFLLQANRQNRKRIRIEHLIVLLLRCLAILLLVLAMSRPLSTSAGLALLPGVSDPVERVVLLDDSGSMAHTSGRTTAFNRAKKVLRRLVDDLRDQRPGDFVTVVRTSRPDVPDLFLAPPGNERADALLNGLDDLEPTPLVFDVPTVLEAVLARYDEEESGRRVVIYVVTDVRHRDWIGPLGKLPKQIGDLLRAAPESARLLVVDVGGSGTQNLGVTHFEPREKLAMAGVPLELEVRVRNYGDAAVYDLPLSIVSDDERGGGRVPLPPIVEVPAGEEVVVQHRFAFVDPGGQALSVRLGEDALPLDDVRHLALRVQDQLNVMLVDGEEGTGTALDSETDMLRLALAPPGDVVSGVRPAVVVPEGLAEEELGDYESIVLCNLESWPSARLADLERFVERGGGLGIFLGDRISLDAYEEVLYRNGEGLLPCRLGRRVEAPSEDEAPAVAPPADEHALTSIFRGDNNPFLRRVRARVRMTCELSAERDPTTKVVLRFEDPNQTPFVLEKPFGRGRVVLFNTTADLDWSSWPRDASYPVTAQEAVRLLAPSAAAGRNFRCGEPLTRGINPARYWPTARLALPGESKPRELHAEPREGSDALWLQFEDTRRAGVYTLSLDTQTDVTEEEYFAVNPDPSEGDLRRADPAHVKAGMEGVEIDFVQPGEGGEVLTITDGTRTELWRTFLMALAVILLIEQLLAWRAARHRPAPTAVEADA